MRLAAENIGLERGGRALFSSLSFELGAGEALVVTGPNGAGKSSLLRAVAGFLALSSGRIALSGGDAEASIGERAHYLGHADGLKGALSVSENLSFWAGALGANRSRDALAPGLRRLGLAHLANFPVGVLSAGQKRRVALARLLVAARPLWLLDEPTTALDAASQAAFADILRERLADGGMIVAATHAELGLTGARELRLGEAGR